MYILYIYMYILYISYIYIDMYIYMVLSNAVTVTCLLLLYLYYSQYHDRSQYNMLDIKPSITANGHQSVAYIHVTRDLASW